MVFNINDTVRDLLGDMGVGVIVDTYINRHDDPDGVTAYVVEFDRDINSEERIFDRFAHEIELYVEPVTVTVDKTEYDELVRRDAWLSCLEAAGVDSWEGYEEAQEMQDD